METTLSENQKKVLELMAEGYSDSFDGSQYWTFDGLSKELKIPKDKIRIYVRALKRKGFVEYTRGLIDMNEESRICGSGHCATLKGALVFNACKVCKTKISDMDDGTCQRCWEDRKCSKCGRAYHEHKLVNGYMKEFEE